ncbi:hypothetical protein BBJ29_000199 [Phytophthora kernoviae]|uniref:Impact N-terminal domain-containing protein n=1 Tax=Phytophthora kernoviae TaxID=325452 RepID=A0A3F2S4V7_9STRA|nr:hypothetical protein BBJ29_000199 [Phytophthora kernoviae]RLN69511.1 hypothetical protein BBP00_00000330 [Phytophthora kernoviae]
MLAYRIIGDFTVKDNDEDGEHGAGSKLSNLLELLKAENVAVVVTRWYGGIKLGPDRFKHINASARQVLEDGGFLEEANLHQKKKDSEVSHECDVPVPIQQNVSPCFDSDPQTLRPRTRTAQAVRDYDREAKLAPLIFHGGSIVDRKSVFQGHACPVSCVGDVRSFLAALLDDRKISRACHNMLAYRITGDFIIKDNDEDREDGAGSKMLHLMELTKAENVAVVVTRWCGGIHLGPDRFKHINACAREALEGGGFIDISLLPQSRKKKSKKQVQH